MFILTLHTASLARLMSLEVSTIRLMYLLLTLTFLHGLHAPMVIPNILPNQRASQHQLMLKRDYGLAVVPAKKSRFEKLATALKQELQR